MHAYVLCTGTERYLLLLDLHGEQIAITRSCTEPLKSHEGYINFFIKAWP